MRTRFTDVQWVQTHGGECSNCNLLHQNGLSKSFLVGLKVNPSLGFPADGSRINNTRVGGQAHAHYVLNRQAPLACLPMMKEIILRSGEVCDGAQ